LKLRHCMCRRSMYSRWAAKSSGDCRYLGYVCTWNGTGYNLSYIQSCFYWNSEAIHPSRLQPGI